MKSTKYHHGDLKNALIRAGIEILTIDGVEGLSLREVARRVGVSHTAPYAHFADKQALVAAISTEGHTQLYNEITKNISLLSTEPLQVLVKTSFAYMQFGLNEPDLFRITFSGVVEQEREHPALVEMTRKNFEIICQIAARCQEAGVFGPGPAELLALNLWGAVHGLISLIQQGQVSSNILHHNTHQQLLLFALDQITQVHITQEEFASILA